MNAKAILSLFELIKDAPEENWQYNKTRLFNILLDFEREACNGIYLEGNFMMTSKLTESVIIVLEQINRTNSLDDILVDPHVRNRFREKLSQQLTDKHGIQHKILG